MDEITITPPAGKSFLDLYGKIREDAVVREAVKDAYRRIRDVLVLQLKRSADAQEIMKRVEGVMPEGSKVQLRVDRVPLLIRGIDMLATRGDIAEVISTKLGAKITEEAVMLQRYFRGDQRAIVRVPRRLGVALVGSRVAIGYTSCKVELAPLRPLDEVRCNRCQLRGHIARTCRGPDRSKLCRRCGSTEHKAAGCRAAAKCLTCGGAHVVESAQCETHRNLSQ